MKDYPHANVLGEGGNRSTVPLNYSTIAAIIAVVFFAVSLIIFH